MTGKKTHGESHTRLHNIWLGIKNRCYNAKHDRYPFYGGRGIRVCEEWKNDYVVFSKWAKTHGYKPHLTIDRIDVNKNYSPSNCRWTDRKNQARNRTSNVFYKGKCLAAWCEELDLKQGTLNRRLKAGWPIEKALFTPLLRNRKSIVS